MVNLRLSAVSLCAAMVVSSVDAGAIRYVDDGAPPGGDGLAWSTAYRYLQDAMAEAAGGAVGEIRIAQGTYQPDRADGGSVTPGDRSASFGMVEGTSLRGGYAGLGAPDPDARNVSLYETILSGDLLGNDAPGFVNNGENSLHVVTAILVGASAELDGVKVTAGHANVAPDNTGAGMRLVGSSPTVLDSAFVGNKATGGGGGMANGGASPTLVGCSFIANAAPRGACMDNLNGSAPHISDCQFIGNDGGFGGCMSNENSNATVETCTFQANEGSLGGAMRNINGTTTITACVYDANHASVFGGAMWNGDNDTTITDCVFTGNSADSEGGAIANTSGGMAEIVDCQFIGNSAEFGGAVINAFTDAVIETCTFGGPDPADANTATATGGAMYNLNCAPSVAGCTFTGNLAQFAGGLFNDNADAAITGCVFDANAAAIGSGALENFEGSDPAIADCTFTGNSALGGGAMRNFDFSSPTITHCNFVDNQGDQGGAIFCINGSNANLTGCLLDGNHAVGSGGAIYIDGSSVTFTSGTIRSNTAGVGAAIVAPSSALELVNSLLAANAASAAGGGILFGAVTVANCTIVNNTGSAVGGIHSDSLTMTNSILRGNASGQISGGPALVSYSNVEAGWPGAGNIDLDPLFVNALAGDFRLSAGSPAIDAGNVAALPGAIVADLDGNPRRLDDPATPDTGLGPCPLVDMGAFEFPGSPACCAADCGDGDGEVGIVDFLALLGAWGPCP